MVALLLPAVSAFLAAVSQETSRGRETPDRGPSYGLDPSGRRGPSLWSGPRHPDGWSLEEEAAEGHVFASPAPPG